MKHVLLALLVALSACNKKTTPPCGGPKTSKVEIKHVDEDSDFMKNVFRHVGSDHDGKPTDEAAIAAGIKAEVDQWRHDEQTKDGMPTGGKSFTDYYLTGPSSDAIAKYLADANLTPPTDHQLVYEPVDYNGKHYTRSYYVRSAAVLDDAAFANERLAYDPNTNRPLMLIDMTDAGRTAWAKASTEAVGHKLAIVVDGRVASAPIIEQPIPNGRASITFHEESEAQQLLKKLGCTP